MGTLTLFPMGRGWNRHKQFLNTIAQKISNRVLTKIILWSHHLFHRVSCHSFYPFLISLFSILDDGHFLALLCQIIFFVLAINHKNLITIGKWNPRGDKVANTTFPFLPALAWTVHFDLSSLPPFIVKTYSLALIRGQCIHIHILWVFTATWRLYATSSV